jgi:hypothetical protein
MIVSTFPLRHISIRVPWHDAGWNGSVCTAPARNTACLKLKNIFENKDEQTEDLVAGKPFEELDEKQLPPCVKERATFMADFSFTRMHEHPYVKHNNKTHSHFRPTVLRYPAYTAAAVPFRWMNRKFVWGDSSKGTPGLVTRFPLEEVSESCEPSKDDLGFETNWLQDHRNHRSMLDCFWQHVRPEDSLVFFYAKQVPLVEDTGRRVIVGVGRVKGIGDLTEYEYDGPPGQRLRSLLWERMVSHSIRPEFTDGFLLPYHEALVKSDEGRAFDPSEVVAFAPEDRFDEFSYATEHVGHDAAISALLACREALLRSAELFPVAIEKQEQWIDRELGRLWKKRGPFPGMGAILSATGIPLGNFVAQALIDRAGDEADPWETWETTLDSPESQLPIELARKFDKTIAKAWQRMPEPRRNFLKLLSRIDLSLEQAAFLAEPAERAKAGVELPDAAFLENPYLIYEATRLTVTPVAVETVDRGLFPSAFIRGRFPVPEPSLVKTPVDARRLRALCIKELEDAAARGDTLRAQADIITRLRGRAQGGEAEGAEVTGDLLAVAEEELFEGEIRLIRMADERLAYQLERFSKVGELICSTVKKRTQARRHDLDVDWRAELDRHLGKLPSDEEEQNKERPDWFGRNRQNHSALRPLSTPGDSR